MNTIKRRDGVEFVVQPYRELLSSKKTALLKKEIRLIAENNGEHIRLFRQADGQYEAVFSRISGYLLGEAVWHYLGRPLDLIYCESLVNKQSALLVVVRNGKVHIDTIVPITSLRDEFLALATGYSHYCIYIYGDVPLSELPEEGKFSFDKTFVKSFSELDKPLFDIIPVDESLSLLDLDEAIQNQRLGNETPQWIVILFSFTVLVIIFSWYENNRSEDIVPKIKTSSTESPFRSMLSTPDPGTQLGKLSQALFSTYGLPGWMPFRVVFDGNNMQVSLHSLGGNIQMLSNWISPLTTMSLHLLPEGALLSMPIVGTSRVPPKELADTDKTLGEIIDRMMQVLPNKSVTILRTSPLNDFKSTAVSVMVDKISPSILELVGTALHGLPLQLERCDFTMTDGLLSGNINLTVLGK